MLRFHRWRTEAKDQASPHLRCADLLAHEASQHFDRKSAECLSHVTDSTSILQVGFFKHVVGGMFDCFIEAFPLCETMSTFLEQNAAAWASSHESGSKQI